MAQKVRDVMSPGVITCEARDSAADAAQIMKQHAIGDVLVLDGGRLRGIVTDRDIVVRVVAEGRDAASTRLADICSTDVVSVTADENADRAVELMRRYAVRRIPIVEHDNVVGIVTMGDLAVERDERSALASVSAARPND